jgi:hypothetical protein
MKIVYIRLSDYFLQ